MNNQINKSRNTLKNSANHSPNIFEITPNNYLKKSLKIFLLYLLFWFMLFNIVSCIS